MSRREPGIPDTSDRSGPECRGAVWRFGRSDRAVGLFAPDQPSTVEPPVSAPEAGASNAPRVPEYPWRVWLLESTHTLVSRSHKRWSVWVSTPLARIGDLRS